MVKNKLLYQQHIMWYESNMINETLDSLEIAIKNCDIDVDLKFCVNLQTYIELPEIGTPIDMISVFMSHPVLKNADIEFKTDNEPFYNIGDWRRDVYSNSHKYTIWGESDCLIPSDYFYILSLLDFNHPHLVTLASRKMWDSTWDIVEHEYLEQFVRLNNNPYTAPAPLNALDTISYSDMESFNNKYDIKVVQINTVKLDGSLVSLSNGLPSPFIPNDMHFAREDTCAANFFQLHNIPQYVIKTKIKGHNYNHPFKRINTKNTRTDDVYRLYEKQSISAMNRFIYSQIYSNANGAY